MTSLAGREHDLTFEVSPTPEVSMSVATGPLDPVVSCSDAVPSSFVCSCADSEFEAAWVRVAGELDMATAPELERTLRDAHSRARVVVLDLREIKFTDSSGLHTIVDASARARERGQRLVLLRAPPDVDHTFQLIRGCDDVEIRDVDPVEPPAYAVQRSLVALSLLRSPG